MFSIIRCWDCPESIILNTSNFFRFNIYHFGFSRKKIFTKIYINDKLVDKSIIDKFIFLISLIKRDYELYIDNNDTSLKIKIEVGYVRED